MIADLLNLIAVAFKYALGLYTVLYCALPIYLLYRMFRQRNAPDPFKVDSR